MYDCVRTAFRPLSGKLEGVLAEMYVDVKNLVTSGTGNLIDASANPNIAPWSPALAWEWRHKDTGAVATADEVKAEWMRVKNAGHSQWLASRQAAFGKLAMTPSDLDRLFAWRLEEDEKILRRRFPEWDTWPADAQMGTLLISWAAGAGFGWPNTVAALKAKAFRDAGVHATTGTDLNENRKEAIIGHFAAAARAIEQGLALDQLHFQFHA